MKKILMIVGLCLAMLSPKAYAVAVGDTFGDEQGFVYEVSGASMAKVIGYDGTAPNPIIPEIVQAQDGNNILKFYVSGIGYEAFKDNQVIESIVIPARITEIPMDAFYNCKMLYKVVFAEGSKLEKIQDYAFYYCTGLIDLVIPTWYQTIGGDTEEFPHIGSQGKAFKDVPNIIYHGKRTPERDKYYGWGARNINGIVDGYLVYPAGNTDKTELLLCSSAAKGAIVIPESVTYIRSKGFENCAHVTSIVLPAKLSECGSQCFTGCTGLTSLISKNPTPPNVNHYDNIESYKAFSGVNKSIPVYVPQGTIPAYKAADGWSQFTNYQELTEEVEEELTKYTVTLKVNDDKMGSVTGAGTYDGGSDVTIEAVPNTGYEFLHWSDNETDNPRTLKLTSDTTITAVFAESEATLYTLTLMVNDAKMGAVAGGGQYEAGTTVQIAAVALEGYVFKKWSDDNTQAIRSVVMDKDITLTAYFGSVELPKFKVTLSVNDEKMGSVEGAGEYEQGSKATIKAIAKEGFQFVKWSDENTAATRELIVDKDVDLTATFEALPEVTYTIFVTANDPTMGTVTGDGVYGENATVTIQAIANEGFQFVKWNDGNTENPRSFVATSDAAFVAIFEKTEGIDDVSGDVHCTKVLRDGNLYLMYQGTTYNIQGTKVQ